MPAHRRGRRSTAERQDSFDVYLPLWLARRNEQIFGALYAASIVYTTWASAHVGGATSSPWRTP